MKRAVTIGLAALALGLPLTYVIAQSRTVEPLRPVTPADAMPAYELFTRLRMLELEPEGEPLRRGPYYVLHAADARGRVLRVVADAELGDILSITPARAPLWRPKGAPRIIHVPEQGDGPDAKLEERDWPADVPADIGEEVREPAPARPANRHRQHRRETDSTPARRAAARQPAEIFAAPPAEAAGPAASETAPRERRNTLAGSPAEVDAHDPLTPVYPTPRYAPPPAQAAEAARSPQPADGDPANAGAAAPIDAQ